MTDQRFGTRGCWKSFTAEARTIDMMWLRNPTRCKRCIRTVYNFILFSGMTLSYCTYQMLLYKCLSKLFLTLCASMFYRVESQQTGAIYLSHLLSENLKHRNVIPFRTLTTIPRSRLPSPHVMCQYRRAQSC